MKQKKANNSLPGQGGLFNQVNFHLYHYAGNNPVKYVDPDGNEIIRQTNLDSMSNYDGNLPNSNLPIKSYGCVVTSIVNMINSLKTSEIKLNNIILNKNNFNENGSLKTRNVVQQYSLVYSSFSSKQGSIAEKYKELESSENKYALGATIKWGNNEDGHTVGVNSMTSINGDEYFEIAPSSNNDIKGGKNRENWIEIGEKLYVPVKDVKLLRFIWENE